MAIDRQAAEIIWECDSCDETHSVDASVGFADGWSEAKRDGWTCRKIAGEWMHFCPSHKA